MPKEFVACVKAGGRVRTKKFKDGRYLQLCFKNGKSFAGEMKHSQAQKAMGEKMGVKLG